MSAITRRKVLFTVLLLILILSLSYVIFNANLSQRDPLGQKGSRPLSPEEIAFINKLLVSDSDETIPLKNLTRDTYNRSAIFFVRDTSSEEFELSCAVESASLRNPTFNVIVLSSDTEINSSDRLVRILQSYENVKMFHVDFGSLTNNNVSTSDVDTRLALLWSHGAIYLNHDIISLKPLRDLPDNFLVNLEDGRISFDAIGWRNRNGTEPELPANGTLPVNRLCVEVQGSLALEQRCGEFKILSFQNFYANTLNGSLVNSTAASYAVKVDGHNRVLLAKLAEKYCPTTFQEMKAKSV
ncbi:uncharacterized protein LOC116179309 [Photinus pyralis]|nr:uncharacterized protein LOC116179309 [Photinus pyralis]